MKFKAAISQAKVYAKNLGRDHDEIPVSRFRDPESLTDSEGVRLTTDKYGYIRVVFRSPQMMIHEDDLFAEDWAPVVPEHLVAGGDRPCVGQEVYVGPGDHNYGGRDRISRVTVGMSAGYPTWFVSTYRTSSRYNWEILKELQGKLKASYGDQEAGEGDY